VLEVQRDGVPDPLLCVLREEFEEFSVETDGAGSEGSNPSLSVGVPQPARRVFGAAITALPDAPFPPDRAVGGADRAPGLPMTGPLVPARRAGV
jgi:hypothetical protein